MAVSWFSRRRLSRLGLVLVLVGSLLGTGPSAGAELSAVGPIDPDNGYPLWYQDSEGLTLALCTVRGLCLTEEPDPEEPIEFPDNFGPEMFWWSTETSISGGGPGGAGLLLLVLGMEGAFLGEEVIDGEQIAFGRVRIRLRDMVPGATYTVTHPYGVHELTTDALGLARISEDIGCFELPCDFSAALTSGIGPFLVWDPDVAPAPPVGFVGDPLVEHEIVGSPVGTNFFRVEGPDAGGPGVDVAETNLFAVTGKIAGANKPTLAPESDSGISDDQVTNADVLTFTGLSIPDVTVSILVDGVVRGSAPAGPGTYSVDVSGIAEGTHQVVAQADDGASPPSTPLTVIVDRTAPAAGPAVVSPQTFNLTNDTTMSVSAQLVEPAEVKADVVKPGTTEVVKHLGSVSAAGPRLVSFSWDGTVASGGNAPLAAYEVAVSITDVAGNGGLQRIPMVLAMDPFLDAGGIFSVDIRWLQTQGITRGCTLTLYCPGDSLTRGQMASFLRRALDLPAGPDRFGDDTGTVHEAAINAIAAAGITRGCTTGSFCPDQLITRGQMAAFMSRALNLSSGPDRFDDTDGHLFEADINAVAAAGITRGCTTNSFCPNDNLTRGQMAAFLRRALGS